MSAPVYVDGIISNSSHDEFKGPIQFIEARTHISDPKGYIAKASDYYVSLFKFNYTLDIPIWIPEMQIPSKKTLIYSITIKSTRSNGIVHRGRAYMQLPLEDSDTILQTKQPTNLYNAFYTYDQVCFSLNETIQAAYALLTDSSPGIMDWCPYFTYKDGIFSLTAGDGFYYNDPEPQETRHEIYFNCASYPLICGWNWYGVLIPGQQVDPNGEDYRILFYKPALQGNPNPIYGAVASQSFQTTLPSIVSIKVLSDLPLEGDCDSKVLAVFEPDLSHTRGASQQFYRADFGNCQWKKLRGDHIVRDINMSVRMIDYLGHSHPLTLYSKSEKVLFEICFAPKDLVQPNCAKHSFWG